MLKALKTKLLSSNTDILLNTYNINESHASIKYSELLELCTIFIKPKQRNQLLTHLKQKLFAKQKITLSSLAYKIKLLFVIHLGIKQNPKDAELQDLILQYSQQCIKFEDFGTNKFNSKASKIQDFELIRFIHNQLLIVYAKYIQKLCANLQTIIFINQFFSNWKNQDPNKQNQANQHQMHSFQSIDLINHGFTVLNLGNFILELKDPLNKMGRYHQEFHEIRSLFLVLVKDLDIYNMYIKRSLALIIRRNIDKEEKENQREMMAKSKDKRKQRSSKSKKKRQLKFEQTTKNTINTIQDLQPSSINLNLPKSPTKSPHLLNSKQKQQINHGYLYMCECQKLSDRLYYFYFNRYYYKKLGSQFAFPSFIKIDVKYEDLMKNRLKRYDRDLLNLIRISKYDESYENTRKRSFTQDLNKTQIDSPSKTSAIGMDRLNYTMYDGNDNDQSQTMHHNKISMEFSQLIPSIKKPISLFNVMKK